MRAKRGIGWAVVAGGLWLLVAVASAQVPQRLGPGRNAGGDEPRRMMPAERRLEQMPADDGDSRGRGQRLSPEERRQLRRDVHDAGRDLYPGRMSPGRRESRRQ